MRESTFLAAVAVATLLGVGYTIHALTSLTSRVSRLVDSLPEMIQVTLMSQIVHTKTVDGTVQTLVCTQTQNERYEDFLVRAFEEKKAWCAMFE